ncbi:MAG: VWA domain-containing protein [Acidobacteriota bacterium]|nr:VWA domain-containing protein [Acidobacteriota bacterium]
MPGILFVAALVAVFVLAPAVPAQAQPQQPDSSRFKVQSATVVVDVIVTDRKGNLVSGLPVGDFQVSENGVPQKILSFEGPAATLTGRPSDAPGVSVQAGTFASRSLRIITIVLDVSNMRGASLKTSIDAALQFVDRAIGAEDFVAVYAIGAEVRLVVPFSRDKQKVSEGLRALSRSNSGLQTAMGRDATIAAMDSLDSQIQTLNKTGDQASAAMAKLAETERLTLQTEMAFQATMQTRVLFRALRAIAQASGNLPGRKNVVLFSEGLPATTETDAGVASVVDASNRANVAFYVIDPSGLGGESGVMGSFDASGASGGRRASQTARDNANAARRSDVVAGDTKFDVANQRMNADSGRDGLRNVADQTGGLLIKNQNELKGSLERIDRDLREFYTLTYQPQDSVFDGSFRKIKVEVSGGGHTVRFRKGYYALAAGEEMKVTPATAQLLASVENGSLKAALKPRLNAAIVFSSPTELSVPVSIWLPGDQSWVSKSDKGYFAGVTMVITARDANGKLLDVFQRFVDARWTKDEWKGIEKKGLQIVSSLTIPKLQSLELEAVLQFTSGAAAVGKTKLNMPGSDDSGARLTSLFITPRVDVSPTVREGDPPALHIANYQLSVPTQTQFAPTDKLTLYFGMDSVSMDAASGSPRINLALALKSGDKVVRELPADSLHAWAKSTNRIFFLDQFDLAGLAPGKYTLQATLKDLAKKTTTIQSEDFSIQ